MMTIQEVIDYMSDYLSDSHLTGELKNMTFDSSSTTPSLSINLIADFGVEVQINHNFKPPTEEKS